MPRALAKQTRPETLDTEDRIMERFLQLAAWMEQHRPIVLAMAIVAVGLAVAGYYYVGYRAKLAERASVRLQEIRLSASGGDFETVRSDLQVYIERFGGTGYGNEARLLLGQLELQRDSLRAAIRALEPAADLRPQSPIAFAAAGMIAAAYEQGGNTDEALDWYRRIEAAARFDYQRQDAMAEQARLQLGAGHYDEGVSLYDALAAEAEEDAQTLYRVRLGEARALRTSGAAPPAPPVQLPIGEASASETQAP
jgi:predicted negative regulator of RcsB-dependent stress response